MRRVTLPKANARARPVLDAAAAAVASAASPHTCARVFCAHRFACINRACVRASRIWLHESRSRRRVPQTHYYKCYYDDVLERRGLGSRACARMDRWAGSALAPWLVGRPVRPMQGFWLVGRVCVRECVRACLILQNAHCRRNRATERVTACAKDRTGEKILPLHLHHVRAACSCGSNIIV